MKVSTELMKPMVALLLVIPFLSLSQTTRAIFVDSNNTGISFERELTWDEVLAKAKAENKYIFLDCYTTWCAPCKVMEKNIYPQKEVGTYFNSHFICIKVQMDRTNNDDKRIKRWYEDALKIKEQFLIEAYPTYLFLAPDGTPKHRFAGAYSAQRFIELASCALDSQKQSYTLMKNYHPDNIDTAAMKRLARSAKYSCPELANRVAFDFFSKITFVDLSNQNNRDFLCEFNSDPKINEFGHMYINSLKDEELYNKSTIMLLANFMNTSTDRGFAFFIRHVAEIDSIMNANQPYINWWSTLKWIDHVIYKEEIEPIYKDGNAVKPDWEKLRTVVSKKHNDKLADRNILAAKAGWCKAQKDYPNYTKYIIQYLEKYSADKNDFDLNNYAWDIFLYSSNKSELTKALYYSSQSISMNPTVNWIDTYANILYKLGNISDAKMWEKVAIKFASKNEIDEFKMILDKMEKKEPTWKN